MFILIAVKSEKDSQPPINWKQVGILGTMMVLWANLHSGFVIGIVFTLLLALRDLFFWLYKKISQQTILNLIRFPGYLVFLACLVASLVTPYGFILWQYIPHLYFLPINHYIVELQPLSFTMVIHNFPLLISFFGLSAFSHIASLSQTTQPFYI